MKIHILTNYDFISYYFMYPLLVSKDLLRELNLFIKYYDRLSNGIYDCDTLLLDSKYFRPLWNKREHTLSLLQRIKDKSSRIIWLDTTDSTGTTHFQVLPYVDKYWKKQLLKDLKLYEREYYGARIYTDYYKNNFNLANETVASVEPIKKEYINKLSVSWNLGCGPYSTNIRISNLMRLIPWSVKEKMNFRYRARACPPAKDRIGSICFRGSSKYTNLALSFQRIKVIERMISYGIRTEPIKYGRYVKELRKSKIGLSPFGSGEICFRDFEIILAGALLLKPYMGHIQTYPDFFIENKTYASFEWDFSDLETKINSFLDQPNIIVEICHQAQEKYKYYFSKKGQEEFCMRFKTMSKPPSGRVECGVNLRATDNIKAKPSAKYT